MASFEELPEDIFRNIFQYSNGKELARCGTICRRIFDFTVSDAEWKLRCERDWNISQLPQNFTTWKECYVDMYGRFGPYLTCYKRVSKCWEKIFAVTWERCAHIAATLRREGIDEETLLRELKLESCDTKLPLEYQCSYRLCNGQRDNFDGHFGLFGYSTGDNSVFMRSYPGIDRRIHRFRADYPASIHRCCLTFIFITESSLSLSPNSRRKGPLALCVRDLEASPARRDCQQDADHERLNGTVVSLYHNGGEYFIFGNSFIEFLENFADRITHYPVVNRQLLLFDFNAECDTGPFTVTVQTMFSRVFSRAFPVEHRNFQFFCLITMRMRPDASQSDSCQLETPHLIMTDATGNVKTSEERWRSGRHATRCGIRVDKSYLVLNANRKDERLLHNANIEHWQGNLYRFARISSCRASVRANGYDKRTPMLRQTSLLTRFISMSVMLVEIKMTLYV